jgi:hypothetical protein
MCAKILYIGARTHLKPTLDINASEYIFIDTQPRSEFDEFGYWDYRFYKKNFYSNLIESARKLNFYLQNTILLDSNYSNFIKKSNEEYPHLNPTLLIFEHSNTGQILKYYISTNIQFNMCDRLYNDISTSTGLIISGHDPNNRLFNYIKYPINLFCYTGTCYTYENADENDKNNIIYWCSNNLSIIPTYFNNIYIVHRKNGCVIKCNDFQHMINLISTY